jgi:SHS2 domain-containing protein
VISQEFILENEGEEYEMLFEANDMETSMVDMLNELLFIFDAEGAVIRGLSFDTELNNHSSNILLKGFKYHSTIPEGKGGMEVKAVTYHGVEIKTASGGINGKVLVDL